MRGSPFQPALWSLPNENIYQSPRCPNTRDQPPCPQVHHNVRARQHNYLSPHLIDAAAEAPVFIDYRSQNHLTPNGMTTSTGSTFTSTAPSIHSHYVEYDHRQYPYDGLNIHLSAPPSYLEPAAAKDSSTQPAPPRSTLDPEQGTQTLLDNKTNLEKMRHEREQVFQKAATELEKVRCDIGSSVRTNKAWEEAWEVLRENLTNM
jgi:hypothetical protein